MTSPDSTAHRDIHRLTYLVPQDTQNILRQNIKRCQNMRLLLTNYVPYEAIASTKIINDRQKEIGQWSSEWLHQITQQVRPSIDLHTAYYQRWKAMTSSAQTFQGVLLGRLIVGLGSKGVLETGLTLQPMTGLPFIPGSALKGVCRAYALYVLAAAIQWEGELLQFEERLETGQIELTDDTSLLEKLVYFQAIFGTQTEAGGCIFYDGTLAKLPPEGQLFEVEVMTPHLYGFRSS